MRLHCLLLSLVFAGTSLLALDVHLPGSRTHVCSSTCAFDPVLHRIFIKTDEMGKGAENRGVNNVNGSTPAHWSSTTTVVTPDRGVVIQYSIQLSGTQTHLGKTLDAVQNTDFLKTTQEQTIQAIQEGIESWNVICGVRLQRVDQSANPPLRIGAVDSLGGTAIGLGGFSATASGSNPFRINQGFVQLRKNISGGWTFNSLRSTAAHEVGHALGLNHTDLNSAVMFFQILDGTTPIGPAADDRYYTQFMHGPSIPELSGNASQSGVVQLTALRVSPRQPGTTSSPTHEGSANIGQGTGTLTPDNVSRYELERKLQGGSFAVVNNNVQVGAGNNASGLVSVENNRFTIMDTTVATSGTYIYRYRAVFSSAGADTLYSNEITVAVTANNGPSITSVTPNSGMFNSTVNNVIIAGTMFEGTPTVSFGDGITVNVTNVTSTEITVNLTIANDAVGGMRTVTVTNPDNSVGLRQNAFTVIGPPPTFTSINPAAVIAGATTTVTILGTNFSTAPAPTVSFSGSNVAANVSSNTTTQIVVSVTADSNAVLGMRNLTITNPDTGTVTANNALKVHARPVAMFANSAMQNVLAGTALGFDATGSNDPDDTNSIVNYAFDFGDGKSDSNNATGMTSNTFDKPGFYTVTLIVTDDEGGQSNPATVLVLVLGGADDEALYLSSGQFSFNLQKTNLDKFTLAGMINKSGIANVLNGSSLTLSIGGVSIVNDLALASNGRASAPPLKFALNLKTGRFSINLSKAALSSVFDAVGLSNRTEAGTVVVPIEMTINGANLLTSSFSGQFMFDFSTVMNKSSKGRFNLKVGKAFSGYFMAQRIGVKGSKDSANYNVTARGFIAAGGGEDLQLANAGSTRLGIGGQSIEIPNASLLNSNGNLTLSGIVQGLKSFQISNARKTFAFNAIELDSTGISGTGTGGTSENLTITLSIDTTEGTFDFETTVTIARNANTSTSWKN